jgi:hypothetical protein
MARKKISELPNAAALTGSELAEIVQSGANVQTTAQAIADLGSGAMTGAEITTALGAQAATHFLGGPTPAFRAVAIADLPFTGTPSSSTYARGDGTWTNVSGAGLPSATSVIYPAGTSYQASQNLVGPSSNNKSIEIVNIGYTGANPTDDIHENTTGIIRINGRISIVRNVVWDQANTKWLTPLQTASAYGSVAVELGGEAVILHATPSGVDFNDVPHEIFLASARGTDGESNHRVTSGYFTQSKACIFARYNSTAYNPATTANCWNETAGTNPLLWLSTGEAKGTETELLRLEGNNAAVGFYFKRSNGSLGSRTIASASAQAGKICWAYYDGADFETTAQIDALSNLSVSSNNMGSRIRFLTSPDTTGNLTERATISSVGYFGIGVSITIPTALVHISASTTARASLCMNPGTAPSSPVNGDMWIDSVAHTMHVRINGVTKTFTLT